MAQQKVVTCSKCGLKIAIPAQYANTAGKCRQCGTIVNQQPGPAQVTAPAPAGAPGGQTPPGSPPNPIDSLLDSDPVQLSQNILDDEPFSLGPNPLDSDEGGVQLNQDLLDLSGLKPDMSILEDDVPAQAPAKPAAPAAQKAADEGGKKKRFTITITRQELVRGLLRTGFWALGSMVLFAVAGAFLGPPLINFIGMNSSGSQTSEYEFVGGAETGILIGLFTGLIWGLIKSFDLDLLAALLTGALVGTVVSLTYHFIEEFLLAPSDIGIGGMAFLGLMGGTFFALASQRFKEYLEEWGDL